MTKARAKSNEIQGRSSRPCSVKIRACSTTMQCPWCPRAWKETQLQMWWHSLAILQATFLTWHVFMHSSSVLWDPSFLTTCTPSSMAALPPYHTSNAVFRSLICCSITQTKRYILIWDGGKSWWKCMLLAGWQLSTRVLSSSVFFTSFGRYFSSKGTNSSFSTLLWPCSWRTKRLSCRWTRWSSCWHFWLVLRSKALLCLRTHTSMQFRFVEIPQYPSKCLFLGLGYLITTRSLATRSLKA